MLRSIKFTIFLVALTPMVIDTGVFFPYVEGKAVVIRLLVTVAWLLTGVHAVFSKDFSERIINRLRILIKNPIFVSFGVFMLAVGVSTLTAFFKFRAFFGDIERGEGFVGLLYLYLFFVLAVVIFERKDWIAFFKLSLLVGAVMFFDSIRQLIGGNNRPSSFTGNPIYLAGYLLFTTYAGLVVFKEADKKFWKWFGLAIVPISLAGILITQTRGVMLGVIAGVIVVVGYLGIKGKNIEIFKNWNARKIAILVAIILVISGGIFFATKNDSFWQKVPGLGRLAEFKLSDANFRTRLISLGVSWNAINPANEGIQKFLFGWGPENFSIAYNKYYNPEYFKYETSWFDRAHNKLMDIMVMNGLFGLLSYLALWLFVIITIFKISKRSLFLVSLGIFFAVAYFIQNLTVFESLPTYVILYAFFGFLIAGDLKDEEKKTSNNSGLLGTIVGAAAGILLLIGFIWTTAVPYFQIRRYISEKNNKETIQTFLQNTNQYLSPYTYNQENIRTDLLTSAQTVAGQYRLNGANGDVLKLYQKALDSMKELVSNEPYNARYYLRLAVAYNDLGRQLNDGNFLNQAINYADQALTLTPNRQDVMYVLGYSYLLSNRVNEAVAVYKKALDADNSVASSNFYYGVALASAGPKNYKVALDYLEYSVNNGYSTAENGGIFIKIYTTFVNYFYSQRDVQSFTKVFERLAKIGTVSEADSRKSIEYAKNGNWQSIKLF